MARMVLNETSYFGAGCRNELLTELNKKSINKLVNLKKKIKLFN